MNQPAEQPGDDPKVVIFRVDPQLHKKLKRAALEKDKTMQALCVEAVEQYLETQ